MTENINNKQKILIYISITAAILALSSAGVLVRKSIHYAPPLTAAFLRTSLATLILVPFVFRSGWRKRLDFAPREFIYSALAGIFLGFHFATWFLAIKHTYIATATTIINTQPVLAAILSYLFFREKSSFKVIIAIVIAMIGVFIIGMGDGYLKEAANMSASAHVFGDIMAVIAALACCIYLMIGHVVRKKHQLIPYIFIVYGFAAITLMILTVAHGYPLIITDHPDISYFWFWIILLAVGPTLIGHSTLNWAVKYLPVHIITLLKLVELCISATLAWLVFGEKELPGIGTYIGAFFIFIALFIIVRSRMLNEKTNPLQEQTTDK